MEGPEMGIFSKDIKSMHDLYVHMLRDMYYAEQQILKALPKMMQKATDRELQAAFSTHRGETEAQIQRLEQAFQLISEAPKGIDCPAIDGIIEEAEDVAGEVDDKEVMDAALVAAAQAVEHYEITRYGTLITWSKQLGNEAVAKLLLATLDEEKATDEKLSAIAKKKINPKAAA
jgi:ferritin-like metal-binding protein YciE